MSEIQTYLLAASIPVYMAGTIMAVIWGYITYTSARDYSVFSECDWELRWGARAMIFCWAWPLLLIAIHAPKAGRLGRFIGGVFRDGMKR